MNPKDLNKSKTPVIPITKSLDPLKGKILFPEKLKQANRILKRAGLPK